MTPSSAYFSTIEMREWIQDWVRDALSGGEREVTVKIATTDSDREALIKFSRTTISKMEYTAVVANYAVSKKGGVESVDPNSMEYYPCGSLNDTEISFITGHLMGWVSKGKS